MNIKQLWAKPPATVKDVDLANDAIKMIWRGQRIANMDIQMLDKVDIADISIILCERKTLEYLANHEKWAKPEYWKMVKGAITFFHAAMGRYLHLIEELDRQVLSGKTLETTTDYQTAKDASFVMLGFYLSDAAITSIVDANRSGEIWGKGWAKVMLDSYGQMPIRMIQDELGLSSPQKRWEEKKRIYRQQQEQQNAV